MRKNRDVKKIRPIRIVKNYTNNAQSSVLINCGNTKVLCTVSIDENIPYFLKRKDTGWLRAEYSMLPSSTHTRNVRESVNGKQNGRSIEIQRFISRALRAILDLKILKKYTFIVDCDVLEADGGTRTASITGSCIALIDATNKLIQQGYIIKNPIKKMVAAVSVGIIDGKILCDLNYVEDKMCEVDMNIVMTEDSNIIEIQGGAEKKSFNHIQLFEMLDTAQSAIKKIIHIQKNTLKKLFS